MSPNEAIIEQAFHERDFLEKVEITETKDLKQTSSDDDKKNEDWISAEDYEKMISQPFYKRKDIKWFNLYFMVTLHAIALYGYLTFPYFQKPLTFLFVCVMVVVANFGVAGGVHRLWSHRAYKAKLPLRIFLMLCYVSSGQYSMVYWSRDHRVHHKFSETSADPVNAARGFWFSHVGWLTMKRHPDVLKKGRQIDMSDILNDPVIQFEEKYFEFLRTVFCFIIPTLIPVYLWNETWYYAIMSQVFMRYAYSLNCTWAINSIAHMFGGRPYDKAIAPAENTLCTMMTGGEGWHNYHHAFPSDYKTSELGNYSLNWNTVFIDLFAKIGWAYDLKTPSKELVKSVILNRGDGTHIIHKNGEATSTFKTK